MIGNHEQAIAALDHEQSGATHAIVRPCVPFRRSGCSLGSAPRKSYACDPEPFEGDVDKCWGFLLQCRLVFLQRSRLFVSDEAKINYVIGLLRGRALACAEASSAHTPCTHLYTLEFDQFVKCFERIIDQPNHSGYTSDQLFTLQQGNRTVSEYIVTFGKGMSGRWPLIPRIKVLCMPFRLTNAPAVFQALANDVLWDMLNKFLFVWIDDILIFPESEEDDVQHVHMVLRRLFENSLFVKAEQCEFYASSVSFLGFVVG